MTAAIMSNFRWIWLTLALGLGSSSAFSEVYRWTDSRGNRQPGPGSLESLGRSGERQAETRAPRLCGSEQGQLQREGRRLPRQQSLLRRVWPNQWKREQKQRRL